MKRYFENVVVRTKDGAPQSVVWRNRVYRVEGIEEEWRYAGKWWIDCKGWQRRYYRATVRSAYNTTQCEILMYKQGTLWVLCGIYD